MAGGQWSLIYIYNGAPLTSPTRAPPLKSTGFFPTGIATSCHNHKTSLFVACTHNYWPFHWQLQTNTRFEELIWVSLMTLFKWSRELKKIVYDISVSCFSACLNKISKIAYKNILQLIKKSLTIFPSWLYKYFMHKCLYVKHLFNKYFIKMFT